jgi:hypothetical protein
VNELHCHRSFADSAGTALCGTGADVASGEHSGQVRAEQRVGADGGARQNEAVVVACHGAIEPVGAGDSADIETMKASMASPPPEVATLMEKHGVVPPPITLYIEA